ncbi:MAG: ATP synthase F0 subunit B [Deltaproteobacteria bacterium]|nr:ATP synthase F0 subunit B [Deltaproteobacteria bacterium]
MIALDYTVIVQIVAFLVLWFLLSKLLFGPFLGLADERERRTEGTKREAAALSTEGEGLRSEYERAIENAREEGRNLREALLEQGRETQERLLAEAREESAKMVQAVREDLRRAMQRERELAAREAEGIARQIAEKVLGRRVG